MKRKLLGLLCGGVMAFSLFAAPGNPVKAAETDEEYCPCHDVTPILGAEKNKLISDLISSQDFKNVKNANIKVESIWSGVNNTEVFYQNYFRVMIIGIPVTSPDGTAMMATFIDGKFMGIAPKDS
jgi:hypothetical protein